MSSPAPSFPQEPSLPMIATLAYEEGAYPDVVLETVVRQAQSSGLRLAGVIQHDITRRDRSRCDMALEDLATGTRIGLSEDRGAAARGCRIDQSGLAHAAVLASTALEGPIDLLVINKFGKIESEGGGLRDVIAEAVSRGVPAVVGVPMRNLDAWNAFAGSFQQRLAPEVPVLTAWIAARLQPPSSNPDRVAREAGLPTRFQGDAGPSRA